MFAVWLLVVTGVIALVVLLTLGRGGGLPEAGPDDVEVDLPDDRPISEADVAALRLPVALRGYRMSDVDDLLDRVAAELAERDARIRDLEAAARGAE
jgi:DivIVA domain-containing protein